MATQTLKLKSPSRAQRVAITIAHGARVNAQSFLKKFFLSVSIFLALYYPRAKTSLGRIVIAIIAIDMVLASYTLISAFMPAGNHVRLAMAAAMEPLMPSRDIEAPTHSKKTAQHIADVQEELKVIGLPSVLAGSIDRTDLSVAGAVLFLHAENDVISVYAYGSTSKAHAEAAALAQKYEKAKDHSIWARKAHVFVKDTTVIFYLGEKTGIIEKLEASYSS